MQSVTLIASSDLPTSEQLSFHPTLHGHPVSWALVLDPAVDFVTVTTHRGQDPLTPDTPSAPSEPGTCSKYLQWWFVKDEKISSVLVDLPFF